MHGKARFGGLVADRPLEVARDPEALDSGGFWVVVQTFEGAFTAVRMGRVTRSSAGGTSLPARGRAWTLPASLPEAGDSWNSSMDERAFVAAVRTIREQIAAGRVYQVNLCRVLSRVIDRDLDLDRLAEVLRVANPAPYAARIDLPEAGLDLVCASPELFLSRHARTVRSGPIKGTARTQGELRTKDHTENVMITDLVRNDLAQVAVPGTISVPALCALEEHPGLVHLVSTVQAQLRAGIGWAEVLAPISPPGSVSGTPRSTALRLIGDLEPLPRGPYCGAIGWVDADRDRAELAVGIRTFWSQDGPTGRELRFGTGAGITWGSDPAAEWCETELKARRLVGLAEHVLGNNEEVPG